MKKENSIPDQTVIKFSKLSLLWFIAMVLVALWGLISLFKHGGIVQHMIGIISVLLGCFVAYMEFRTVLLINEPRLILSVKGITDSQGQFYNWNSISSEKLMTMGSYKPNYFLSFKTSEGNRQLHLHGLDKTPTQIMELIRQYRELMLSARI